MKLKFGRKSMAGAIGTLVVVGIGLALVGAAGIAGWEYTNSNEFCAVMCDGRCRYGRSQDRPRILDRV